MRRVRELDWWVLVGCLLAITCAFLAGHFGDPVDVMAFGYFAVLFSVVTALEARRTR